MNIRTGQSIFAFSFALLACVYCGSCFVGCTPRTPEEQNEAVDKVLHEIGIDEKETLLVLNKVDCEGATERVKSIQDRYPNSIPISAHSGLGIQRLSRAVSDALTKNFVELEVRLPLEDGKTIAWLASVAEVMSKQYNDDHALVHCRMPSGAAGKLAGQGADIRVISGRIPIAAEKNRPNDATFLPPLPSDASNNVAGDGLVSGTESGSIGEVA